jgi:DNA-binding transcriptional LysR family regulator
MSRSIPWDSIETFLAVMRHGSLSAAGRVLRLAQPTVRRHIEKLEAALGAPLFTRAPGGLVPTDAAHRLLPYAETMGGAAAAMRRSAQDEDGGVAGTIRLSCSEIMAIEVVPYLLGPLMQAHPLLEVELVASNTPDDLLRRDADIAVRMMRPTQVGLVARKIGDIPLGLYASPTLLKTLPAPRSLADLIDRARLIGQDRETIIVDALAALGVAGTPRFVIRSDNDAAQLAAVRAGLGIGICQRPLAMHDARLHPVLPDLNMSIDCWLAMHEDLRAQPRARAVFDHLAAALSAYLNHGLP